MVNFIIIKYKVQSPLLALGVCWQWAKVSVFGEEVRIRDIDRSKALELIKEYGLTLAQSDSNGKVWDKDGEFKKEYQGKIKKFD